MCASLLFSPWYKCLGIIKIVFDPSSWKQWIKCFASTSLICLRAFFGWWSYFASIFKDGGNHWDILRVSGEEKMHICAMLRLWVQKSDSPHCTNLSLVTTHFAVIIIGNISREQVHRKNEKPRKKSWNVYMCIKLPKWRRNAPLPCKYRYSLHTGVLAY